MKKKEALSVKVISFFILLMIAEIFIYLVEKEKNFSRLMIVPAVFLLTKVCYDFILAIKYREKIFLYFEDYLKEIGIMILVSFLALVIIVLTEHFLLGSVSISIIAAISAIYLKK